MALLVDYNNVAAVQTQYVGLLQCRKRNVQVKPNGEQTERETKNAEAKYWAHGSNGIWSHPVQKYKKKIM